MKYLIYSATTGEVWRELDQYTTEDDGTIMGGLNGTNTLRYPASVSPAILEISDSDFNELDVNNLGKYLVQDGTVIANPNWTPYIPDEESEINYELANAVLDKIAELSKICNNVIESGATVNDKHYSMALTDQLNLESLKTTIMAGATAVPYHADNEACTLYSKESFLMVYNACAAHKIQQTTYFNHLKEYVKTLTSADDIKAIHYGQALTGKYLESFNTIMSAVSGKAGE